MTQGEGEGSRRVSGWPLDSRQTAVASTLAAFVVLFAVRGYLEEQRPAAAASLRGATPTPSASLRIVEPEPGRHGNLAQARALRLPAFDASHRLDRDLTVEIVAPVGAVTCRRLEVALDLGCGRARAVSASILTLDWERVVPLRLGLRDPRSLVLGSVGSTFGSRLRTWTLDPAASTVTLDFPCLRPASFNLVVPGRTVRGSCDSNGRTMRIAAAAPPGHALSIFLDDTRALSLSLRGRRVGGRVDRGVVTAGGATEAIERRGEAIDFTAGSARMKVDLNIGSAPGSDQLDVGGPNASSVVVDGSEQLPTRYDGKRDIWWGAFFTLLSLLLASLGALVWPYLRRSHA